MKKSEYAARLNRFLDALAERGLDGAVLDSRNDYFYLTGYTGSESVAVLSARTRKGWIVTDMRYTEEAEKTAHGMEVVAWKTGFAQFVGGMLRKQRMKNVGFTPGTMTAAFYVGMQKEAPGVKEWADVEPDISALRAVKSPAEVAAIRTSLACQEKAFLTAKKRWRAGMTEIEVKNDLEWEMRRNGADNTSFETIAAAGSNASLPHAHSGDRKIQPGKMFLMDFGAVLNRYCSDLTRTLWPGDIPAVWKKRYLAVLEAQQAGIDAIRAGVFGKTVHQKAVDVFARHKMADKFTHGLGHGIGLAVHENPRLAAAYAKPLAAGNIVTVEPGVYFPGSGGIRTEDMVLVTEDGAEILSSLPKSLDSAVF